jgi:serine/alanine adding enzyme
VTLDVRPFSGSGAEWDQFIRSSPGWTHCHLWGWKHVLEEGLGHECLFLAAAGSAAQPEAVLPLVRVRSMLFGRYLVSMPFLNYGGPIGSPAGVQALAADAVHRADAERARLLELRSRGPLELNLPVSHRKITVVLDLPIGSADPLWKALDAKVRSQVRRPQKEGVTVAFGLDQLDAFYTVLARHMRDLGTPVQAKRLFRLIADTFPEDVWFGCAYVKGRPVAGGCGFRWGDEFEMTWASALREFNPIAPNMLLYWAFMERAVAHGIRRFNFGRCTPGGGTHRFKRQWGSRDEQLWWYQHGRGGVAATPSPDHGAYAWGPRVWQHLPLALANFLGPHIVRCIP